MIRKPKIEMPKCEICGTELVERQGYKNWTTFLDCPNNDCPFRKRAKGDRQ